MTTIAPVDHHMVAEIRSAVKECSDRGLTVASKWASEMLLSIPESNRQRISRSPPPEVFSTSTPARSRSPNPGHVFAEPSPGPPAIGPESTPLTIPHYPHATSSQPRPDTSDLALETHEADILVAARGCMESKEFRRAVYVLRDCGSLKARFLHVYNQFIVGERAALRDWHKLDNTRQQLSTPLNALLPELMEAVQDATDPWLLFLKAIFLSRLSRREEAIEAAILSIAAFPWNWSAWTLLGSCIGDGEELSSLLPLIRLAPNHPLLILFQLKTLNELHNPSEQELALCDQLLQHELFPNSLWIMSLRACVLYHLHDFAEAEIQFEKILAQDPYRIDDIDVFSNILYVTENSIKLSRLAQEFLALDKDRPEVCCLVGNHYSLRSEHEKAVKYFRRATQLDRTYLSAWTLMGHEYVEMKNSHAAIEAYRRAVDVNRKDYRAWYGLGQAYELLSMHNYALHYYQHATALRPYDVRLWQAQAMCYEEIGRYADAIECFKRALITADPQEINIKLRLARLHRILNRRAESVVYHRKVVEVCQADLRPVQDYAKSCLEVAEYQMQIPDGDLLLAREYLERVASSNAEDVARAAELLKAVKEAILARAGSEGRKDEIEDTEGGGKLIA